MPRRPRPERAEPDRVASDQGRSQEARAGSAQGPVNTDPDRKGRAAKGLGGKDFSARDAGRGDPAGKDRPAKPSLPGKGGQSPAPVAGGPSAQTLPANPGVAADRILVGALAGAFGVAGEVRLKSFCAVPEDIAGYSPLWTEDGSRSLALRLTRQVPNGFSARIKGVNTREEAEALKGTRLYADRSRLPSLPDDEFYHADLIGLSVVDTGGAALGKVRAVLNHGAGDILEVHAPGAKDLLLIPFTLAFVPTVDLAAGRIVVDPPAEADDADDGPGPDGEPQ